MFDTMAPGWCTFRIDIRWPRIFSVGPHAPRRIFDVTLDLQLIEPLFRRQLSIERYALAFDCRKVSRGQEFHERELQLPPLFRGGRYGGDCLGKAPFPQEHRPTLFHLQFEELPF